MQPPLRPLLLALLGLLLALRPAPAFSAEAGDNRIAALAATAEAFNAVAERVRPAVVYIHVRKITAATDRASSAAENFDSGSRTYSVVTRYCQTPSFCPSVNTRHLRVEVSYRSVNVLNVETVYTKLR